MSLRISHLEVEWVYAQKDEKQGIPPYLRALRQSLIYNFLENNPNATPDFSKELEQHLAILFKPENDTELDLMSHAQRYQKKISNEKYSEAYTEALESNKQIMKLYTKLLGDDGGDPIVAQMAQLRVEMKEAYKSGIVSAQGSAETLHKVNLELVNSIAYLAGPKLPQFKPIHTDEDWEKLKADSVDITSPTKKWAHRVLMGVGMSLALVLIVGTGGVAAAPIVAADIASAVSPTIANSAIGSITSSSILARAQRVMRSSKQENEHADRLFNTAAGLASNLTHSAATKARVAPVAADMPASNPPNKSVASPTLSPNHSGLFHHDADHVRPQEEETDSDGSKDSGHVEPIRK